MTSSSEFLRAQSDLAKDGVNADITKHTAMLEGWSNGQTATSVDSNDLNLTATSATVQDVAANSNTSVNLPDAATCKGKLFTIQRTDATGFTFVIAGTGGQTIDGNATMPLTTQNQRLSVISDSFNWNIFNFYLDTGTDATLAYFSDGAHKLRLAYTNFGGYAINSTSNSLNSGSASLQFIAAGETVVMTLPAASAAPQKVFMFKRTDATGNNVSVETQGGDTFDGSGTSRPLIRNQVLSVASDGDDWYVIEDFYPTGTNADLALFSNGNNGVQVKYPPFGGVETQTGSNSLNAGSKALQVLDASGGTVDIDLPSAASATGKIFTFKRTDNTGNQCRVLTTDTVDDSASAIPLVRYQDLTVYSDGTEWWILSNYYAVLPVAKGGLGTNLFTYGSATFATAGSVAVTDTSITASSKIVVTQAGNTVLSDTYSVDVSAGVGFTIYSTNPISTATVNYIRVA